MNLGMNRNPSIGKMNKDAATAATIGLIILSPMILVGSLCQAVREGCAAFLREWKTTWRQIYDEYCEEEQNTNSE